MCAMPDKKPPGVLDEWQRTSETKSVVFHHLCVTGPDRASFWATFGVIVVPAIHFLVRTFVSLHLLLATLLHTLILSSANSHAPPVTDCPT